MPVKHHLLARRAPLRVAVLAAAAVGATAALPAGAHAATFSGTCPLKGTLTLDKGVTFKNEQNSGTLTATGNCGGGTPASLQVKFSGPLSCTGSTATNQGSGTFSVNGNDYPVKAQIDIKLPNGRITLGVDGGSGAAGGQLAFGTPSNGGQMLRCPGAGLSKANFGLSLRVSSPLTTPSAGGGGGGSARTSVAIGVGKRQANRTVRSRGYVGVRCTPSAAGTCAVRVTRGKTVIASGRARAQAGKPVTVRAKLTKAGRRALKRTFTAQVRATSGGAAVVRTVTFRK